MIEILFGFIFGLLSSWLFWRYLLFVKPKITIPDTLIQAINHNENIEYIYRTENLGKRQVVDIEIKATICEYMKKNSEYPLKLVHRLKVDLDKADILNVKNESLSPWSLPSYRGFHIQQIDENTNKTLDILKLLSNSNRRLVITIKASDSISRTTVATRKTYRTNEITVLKGT